MSKLCSLGIHAYRHVSISPAPDPLHMLPAWWYVTRCRRCRVQRRKLFFHYPLIIRTHGWGTK